MFEAHENNSMAALQSFQRLRPPLSPPALRPIPRHKGTMTRLPPVTNPDIGSGVSQEQDEVQCSGNSYCDTSVIMHHQGWSIEERRDNDKELGVMVHFFE